ncbi:unnamed protein product [Amoebophrya sp. A25]|nr:unnamed protein product [Amoebophrya sp. A25]|eukprot:GSA25T00006836001.1
MPQAATSIVEFPPTSPRGADNKGRASTSSKTTMMTRNKNDVPGAAAVETDPSKKSIFDEKLLKEFLDNVGAKQSQMPTIWRVLLRTGGDWDALYQEGTFPATRLVPLLKQEFAYCTSSVSDLEQSALDGTIKLLIRLSNGSEVEAVIINHTGEDMNSSLCTANVEAEMAAPAPVPEETGAGSSCSSSSSSTTHTTKNTNSTKTKKKTAADSYLDRGLLDAKRPRIEMRKTLCVSSQIGCKLGCTFCATGTMKLERSLTSGEIMEQLLLADHALSVLTGNQMTLMSSSGGAPRGEDTTDHAEEDASSSKNSTEVAMNNNTTAGASKKATLLDRIQKERHSYFGSFISNIVFMGMGEPLENYDNVVSSLKGMCSQQRFGLGQRNVTISTVGIVPQMRQLFLELPNVKLALSLHAPNQELRNVIVPVSKKYPLPELMSALDEYASRHATDGKRKGLVMISYIMIDGVNDTAEHCYQLCELLKGRQVLVNLIPFNQFDPYANQPAGKAPSKRRHPAEHYRPSKPEQIVWFCKTIEEHGIKAFERRPHGRDISAACGQLAKINKTDGSVFAEVGEIEGNQRKYINKVVPLSREVVKQVGSAVAASSSALKKDLHGKKDSKSTSSLSTGTGGSCTDDALSPDSSTRNSSASKTRTAPQRSSSSTSSPSSSTDKHSGAATTDKNTPAPSSDGREDEEQSDLVDMAFQKLQKTQYAIAGAAIVAFAGLCVWKFCTSSRGGGRS